jgi:hypothetical protein
MGFTIAPHGNLHSDRSLENTNGTTINATQTMTSTRTLEIRYGTTRRASPAPAGTHSPIFLAYMRYPTPMLPRNITITGWCFHERRMPRPEVLRRMKAGFHQSATGSV